MTTSVLEDLVTTAEAARRLGVSRQRMSQLAQRDHFPDPLGRVGQAVVYRWPDVEAWWVERDRVRAAAHVDTA